MTTISLRSMILMLVLPLAGCGGSSDPVTTTDSSAPLTVAATQTSADALVSAAGSSTMDISMAQSLSSVPTTLNAVNSPASATLSGSYACSALGNNGSGDIGFTGTVSLPSGDPQSLALTINDCTFSIGLNTYALNGSESSSYLSYVSSTDFVFSESWNVTLAVTGAWTYTRDFNGTASCSADAGALSCAFDLGSSQIEAGFSATQAGSVTTVNSANLMSRGLTMVMTDWVYDSAVGYAVSGSVLLTDATGNSSLITAMGGGTYTVVNTVGGMATSYTVTK